MAHLPVIEAKMEKVDSYAAATEFLFTQIPAFHRIGGEAYKPGLERTLALSRAFGNPHTKLRTIHVGGTNGKGSVSSTLASILQSAGYRVGLFTSPHILDFRERIRVDGQMISEQAVVDFVNRYADMVLDIEPSFFELTTVMALEHFVDERVDIAVIEVGLGGRLDSTNIIDPMMSVITNISLEHTDLLGDTLEKIAAEKAGIIKPGRPVVVGMAEGSVRKVFADKASATHSPIVFANELKEITEWTEKEETNRYTTRNHGIIAGELTGSCQAENMATILASVDTLRSACNLEITDEHIRAGAADVRANTGLTGRWTPVGHSPLTVVDTGHNPGCWDHICEHLKATPGLKRLIIGFVGDKDVDSILQLIESVDNVELTLTQPSVERRLPIEKLAMLAASHSGLVVAGEADNVVDAYKKVLAASMGYGEEQMIFIGGSTFVVADFLQGLNGQR